MQENNNKQEPQVSSGSSTSGPTTSTPEVKDELSKVASSPKRNILVIVSMAIGFIIMAYNCLLYPISA